MIMKTDAQSRDFWLFSIKCLYF